MNREPVNPDDPQMTSYLLGELNAAEAAEFELRLKDSPNARRELASMSEVMSLLSSGLRREWQEECARPQLKLVEPAELGVGGDSIVVVGNFGSRRLRLAAAAAIAAMLLVGTALYTSRDEATESSGDLVSSVVPVVAPDSLHVPKLFLADEVEDLSSLDLAGGIDLKEPDIDASYLEADAVIPASFQPAASGSHYFSVDGGPSERVDSYLPPVRVIMPGRPTTGMIERRLGRGDSGAGKDSSRVLVSGYVTMDGGADAMRRGGFRLVSISGNPVVNEESEFRLLADLNGLQRDLSEVIGGLPEHSEKRAELERILARSQRVVSQLEMELTR